MGEDDTGRRTQVLPTWPGGRRGEGLPEIRPRDVVSPARGALQGEPCKGSCPWGPKGESGSALLSWLGLISGFQEGSGLCIL